LAGIAPFLEYLETSKDKPSDEDISARLHSFDADGVHEVWTKAMERRSTDPEGAITIARTLLETVCKQILERMTIKFDEDKADLPELYRMTSQALNLAPGQHTQDTFKKILGGVTSVVNELGSLRNRIGDAHGKGSRRVRPATRHAELAVISRVQ
jgi:abortive infection Abi-like protein